MRKHSISRRRYLALAGSAFMGALAGCSHNGGPPTDADNTIAPKTASPTPRPTVESKTPVSESRLEEFTVTETEILDDSVDVTVKNTGSENVDLADYAVVVQIFDKYGDEVTRTEYHGDDGAVAAGESVTVNVGVRAFIELEEASWVKVVIACPSVSNGDVAYCG